MPRTALKKAVTSRTATSRKTAAKTRSSSAKPAVRKSASTQKAAKRQDAIALLRADHALVSSLFAAFEKTKSNARKYAIVSNICRELTVHAQVEEEIFYPAVKAALKDKELIPEATVEHATAKDLITQLEGVEPNGEMYDAKVKVLSEYIKHHVKEEHEEMFPKAKKTKLDMDSLGLQMAQRKQELLTNYGINGGATVGSLLDRLFV